MKHCGTVQSLGILAARLEFFGGTIKNEALAEIPVVEIGRGQVLPAARDGSALCFVLLDGGIETMDTPFTSVAAPITPGQSTGALEALSGSGPAFRLRTTKVSRLLCLDRDRLQRLSALSARFAQLVLTLPTNRLANLPGAPGSVLTLEPLMPTAAIEAFYCALSELPTVDRSITSYLIGTVCSPHARHISAGIAAELKTVGRVFRSSLRSTDVHWIDEEGGVRLVLPQTTVTAAHILARRLQDRLAREVVHDNMDVCLPHIELKFQSVGRASDEIEHAGKSTFPIVADHGP